MHFREFKIKFKDTEFITSSMLQYFFDNKNYIQRQVSEWLQKGWIIQLKRGLYMIDENNTKNYSIFQIANKIVEPSYISNETALSYRGIIPEGVFTVTSITSKNTKFFENKLGTFEYKHIKITAFTGFIKENDFFIATPEKAIVDFLYFKSKYIRDPNSIVNQFRLQNFGNLDFNLMKKYLKLFKHKKLDKMILFLQDYNDGYNSI